MAAAKKAATKKPAERAVVVTTEYRGVFFGYATDTSGDTIKLRAGRNCLYWRVEQVPLQPPAMGNYETRVSVRAARTREERGALPYCLRADGRACTCVSPCAIALEVALQEVRPLRVIQEGGDA